MKTFVDLDTIDILCGVLDTDNAKIDKASNESQKDFRGEVEYKHAGWSNFTIKIKKLWQNIRPIISELNSFFAVATSFLKGMVRFCRQCKKIREIFI